jgi:plasmid stabilization system protein ParE
MSDVKRELIFTNVFLDDLIEIEEYIGRNNPKKGRQFTSKVYDYILDMIQIFPFANPKNSFDYEEENIRKGVFDKHHVILYEITETTIDILRIYHTSRNIDNINPK